MCIKAGPAKARQRKAMERTEPVRQRSMEGRFFGVGR